MFGNKGSKNHYRVGGTRGGQDQFKWDDVKTDKYRENYLGHSVLAPVGRWQKGRDLTWYAKNKEQMASGLEEERRRMKELDEDILNASLGIKAKKKWNENTSLDSEDLKQLLARGSTLETEEAERGKGLGIGQAKFHDHIERKSHVQKQIDQLKSGSSDELNANTSANYISLPNKLNENSLGDVDVNNSEGGNDHKKHKRKHHKEHKSSKKKKKKHSKDDREMGESDHNRKRRRKEERRSTSSSESSRSRSNSIS